MEWALLGQNWPKIYIYIAIACETGDFRGLHSCNGTGLPTPCNPCAGSLVEGHGHVTFKFTNKCSFPVWPAIAPSAGFPVVADGGFSLHCDKNRTKEVQIPSNWCGRFWGRTGCNSSSESSCTCQTGDCEGKKACNGTIGMPPATLVEVSLQAGKPCSYGISLVDGYNLPISISSRPENSTISLRPKNSTCSIDGCTEDINSDCPEKLRVLDKSGDVVACKSACLGFQKDEYCCTKSCGSPETCKPTKYSKIFKKACPSYVSYAYETPLPLKFCKAKQYVVTFCPSKPSSHASV